MQEARSELGLEGWAGLGSVERAEGCPGKAERICKGPEAEKCQGYVENSK